MICIYFCGALQEGDTGRGFAVVAEEIRNLAEDATEKSKQSSRVLKEIMQSISEIAQGTTEINNAVQHVFDISGKNREGVEALDAEMKKFTL